MKKNKENHHRFINVEWRGKKVNINKGRLKFDKNAIGPTMSKEEDGNGFITVECRGIKVSINKSRLKKYIRKAIIRAVVINVVSYILTQTVVLH